MSETTTSPAITAECIRILQCFSCRSMEELPDYAGPAEHDAVLHHADLRHGGASEMPHARTLLRVEKAHWDKRDVRKQIVEQMWKDTKGFVPEYYHTRDTMKEEAAKCFSAHRRSVPCIDYQDRSKRLGNPAAADRKALSRDTRHDFTAGGPKVFLCNFCPVQTYVDRAKLEANPGLHHY